MKEELQRLWALQQIDNELKTLTTRANDIPARIQDVKNTAAKLQAGLEATKQAIIEHKKQYKLAEVELKAAEDKIATYSVQLYSAKTNEQYKAFLKEIETEKRRKAEIEDRMIQLMEELEQLERNVRQDEKRAAEVTAETAQMVKTLEAEACELATAIAERQRQRAAIAAELPPELLKRYERIRQSKGGVAVACTKDERCNGCLSPIPPQRLLEVARQDRLYLCEACGRILIPEQE
ncbi:MAG: hypothetical protein ABIK44_07645 [candidate division WOR-3 bacterium]